MRKKEKWTTESVEDEIMKLKPKNKEEIIPKGMKEPKFKKGRPKKLDTIKTNLDLTEILIDELDDIANFMGTNRQAIIKNFIFNGLNEYYKLQGGKKR